MSLRAWFKDRYYSMVGPYWFGFGAVINVERVEVMLFGRSHVFIWNKRDRMKGWTFSEEQGPTVINQGALERTRRAWEDEELEEEEQTGVKFIACESVGLKISGDIPVTDPTPEHIQRFNPAEFTRPESTPEPEPIMILPEGLGEEIEFAPTPAVFYPYGKKVPLSVRLEETGTTYEQCDPVVATHVMYSPFDLRPVKKRGENYVEFTDKSFAYLKDITAEQWLRQKKDGTSQRLTYCFVKDGQLDMQPADEQYMRRYEAADQVYRRTLVNSSATHVMFEGALHEIDWARTKADDSIHDRLWGTDDRFLRLSEISSDDWYIKIKDRHGAR